jgi:hypothetical protein
VKGRHHVKEGALNSDPLVRVQSGWCEVPGGSTLVYVVVLSQPSPGKLPRDKAGERLEATARQLTKLVLDASAKR